jgi:hypothetical protein
MLREHATPRPTLTNRGWGTQFRLGDGRQDAEVEILRRVSQSLGDWETAAPQDDKRFLWGDKIQRGALVSRGGKRRKPKMFTLSNAKGRLPADHLFPSPIRPTANFFAKRKTLLTRRKYRPLRFQQRSTG